MSKGKVASSWSGGKDSCLACYRALRQGYQVKYLLNFISEEFKRVSFHGIKDDLLQLQAKTIGIDLFQRETTGEDYEQRFIDSVKILKSKGIESLVCGDIHLAGCKEWVEKSCLKAGVVAIEPLWGSEPKHLLREFVDKGFKTIVVSCQSKLLGKEWIGRTIDNNFIDDLKKQGDIDLCGENGEFHTFVIDGPIFKKRINIIKSDVVLINGYWFLDIQKFNLKERRESAESII